MHYSNLFINKKPIPSDIISKILITDIFTFPAKIRRIMLNLTLGDIRFIQ